MKSKINQIIVSHTWDNLQCYLTKVSCVILMLFFVFSDASFAAWQKDASGNMKRSLNYTITINNPLIGKFSTATENQVCLHPCQWCVHASMGELWLTAYLSSNYLSDAVQRIQGWPVLPGGLGGVHSRRSLSRLLLHSKSVLHHSELEAEVSTEVRCYEPVSYQFGFTFLKWLPFKLSVVLPGSVPMWSTGSSRGAWSSPLSPRTPGVA